MPEAPRFAWLNGVVRPVAEATVSAFDRGFLLGDGIFETFRARGGVAIELDAHLVRLRQSARTLRFALPDGLDQTIEEAVAAVLSAEDLAGAEGDGAVRITVTRGPSPSRGLLPHATDGAVPTILVQAWPHVPPAARLLARGLRLVVASTRRDPSDPLAAAKTISRAAHVHARLLAAENGADDALFLTTDSRVCEASSANVFAIFGGRLATPSLASGILAGTTRRWVLGWAQDHGIPVAETDLTLDDLRSADEAFITSSIAGVVPVTRVGDAVIGSGEPGALTQQIRTARENHVERVAAERRPVRSSGP